MKVKLLSIIRQILNAPNKPKVIAQTTFWSSIVGTIVTVLSFSADKELWSNRDTPTPVFHNLNQSDSLNILVTHFDDYFNRSTPNPIGKMISSRIVDLAKKKKLPIKVKYENNIRSPQDYDSAKILLQQNNGELLIYGQFKKEDETNYTNGHIRFRTVSNNLVPVNEKFDPDLVEKFENQWRPFNDFNIENNEFLIDSVAFDNWIQSLSILKKKNFKTDEKIENFEKYLTLYTDQKHSLEDKISLFIQRARLNQTISNYYDAVSETDSAIYYANLFIDSLTKSRIVNIKDPNLLLQASLWAAEQRKIIYLFKEFKYYNLASFQKPSLAIDLIDKEIDFCDSVLYRNPFLKKYTESKNLPKENTDQEDMGKNQDFDNFFGKEGISFSGGMTGADIWDLNFLYAVKTHILLKNFNTPKSIAKARESYDKIDLKSTNQNPNVFHLVNSLVLTKKEKNKSAYQKILYLNDSLKIAPKDSLIKYSNAVTNFSREANKSAGPGLYFWVFLTITICSGIVLFVLKKQKETNRV